MKNLHNIEVYESQGSDKVMKFLTENDVQDAIVNLVENGVLTGLYYNEKGEIVAEDIFGDVHTEVLK